MEKSIVEILILGSSSFVGKNLTRDLAIESIYSVSSVSLRTSDWRSSFRNKDIIINLVGKAHDHDNKATDEDYFLANVELVKEIYNEFVKSTATLLIHFSSIAAVEEVSRNEKIAETSFQNPKSVYGKTKKIAEEFLNIQPYQQGKKIIILRPPMIYGEGDKGNLSLLYNFVSKGIPYPLTNFKNERSLLSVKNLSFVIHKIIERRALLDSTTFNISDDEPVSTEHIVEIIESTIHKKIMRIPLPQLLVKLIARIGDVLPLPINSIRLSKLTSNLVISNSKVKRCLGFEKMPISTQEGLSNAFKNYDV